MTTNIVTATLYAIDRKVRAAGMRPLSAQELQALARMLQAHLPAPGAPPSVSPPSRQMQPSVPMTTGLS